MTYDELLEMARQLSKERDELLKALHAVATDIKSTLSEEMEITVNAILSRYPEQP